MRKPATRGNLIPDKGYDLVYIEWLDSRRLTEWEYEADIRVEAESLEHKSVGFLVRETPASITVSGHFGEDPHQFCGSMTIPRCAIRKIKTLQSAKKVDKAQRLSILSI